jgi:uncharacterized protein with HEPN domain
MKPDPGGDHLLLTHILQCIQNIEEDVQGQLDRLKNRTIRDAVLRNLQVLAESSQRLSDTAKASAPEIPWKQIEGFRHRLVHDYFNIDMNIIRNVVEQQLPALKAAAAKMLA